MTGQTLDPSWENYGWAALNLAAANAAMVLSVTGRRDAARLAAVISLYSYVGGHLAVRRMMLAALGVSG